MTAFGFPEPPAPVVPAGPQLLRRRISCRYENEAHEVCDFDGEIIAINPDDLNTWTCPSCEGLHEEDPAPGLDTEKKED